ncbi:hypothetical protein Dda_4070 [Drechslerella dactyloides]|uniref:Uncharacterized protein n=1 Tax=Drechslerella dactyloides TaxID=74499 RepID=A0AAD6NKI3_DREDA|nr:hypothetical protein Dda_4070 [Drechslerella dactyloides]
MPDISLTNIAQATGVIAQAQDALARNSRARRDLDPLYPLRVYAPDFDEGDTWGFPLTVREYLGLNDFTLWHLLQMYEVVSYKKIDPEFQSFSDKDLHEIESAGDVASNREQCLRDFGAAIGVKFDKLESNQRCNKCRRH